jgi:hypothetical protein
MRLQASPEPLYWLHMLLKTCCSTAALFPWKPVAWLQGCKVGGNVGIGTEQPL